MTSPEERRAVDRFFDNDARYWRDVYGTDGLDAQIYKRRHERVVRRVEELNLPSGAAALEVGCGAGKLAISLAQRGFDLTATDSSAEMLRAASQRAVAEHLSLRLARTDAHSLPFEDRSFDLVTAIGVVPWVADPQGAINEMARILKPGGSLVMTSDNLGRMNVVLDPRKTPVLGSIRKGIGRRLRAAGLASEPPEVAVSMYRRRDVLGWLTAAGLTVATDETIGFGPLTFLDRHVLSEKRSIRLDERLQTLADRGVAGIAAAGAHQLVVARKPE
ncbi:MAG: class I SAM-dependent methyltransferase [Actinomycetota bacterium]